MLKYSRAIILRTQMQITQFANITRIVSLFTAIIPPLCQMITQRGVFLRNLILAICAAGFAVFTLFADAKKFSKKDRKKAKKIIKAVKFVANLYALFVLGYGIYCANEAPTLFSLLSLLPVALSIVIYIIALIIDKMISAQLELLIDAVEMDFKPFIESWKKVEKFIHTVANDGVEINTEIQVSEENRRILQEAVVVLEGETAKKKARKKIEKKKKKEERTKLARAFVKGLFTYRKRTVTDAAPAIEAPETVAEIPTSAQTPAPQIEAPKKKNPLAFLIGKKKKTAQQLAMPQEECAEEEAIPKA